MVGNEKMKIEILNAYKFNIYIYIYAYDQQLQN